MEWLRKRRKVRFSHSLALLYSRKGSSQDKVVVLLQAIKPKLTAEQLQQLQLCFSLMDADGSGNIDAGELGNALQVSLQ